MKILNSPLARIRAVFATFGLLAFVLVGSSECRAQNNASASAGSISFLTPVENYFADWFVRSDEAKREQPHWITPLVTVTPRLEQEVRFDETLKVMPHGIGENDSGGGRVELIPWHTVEVILGAPPFVARSLYAAKGNATHGFDNWGDVSFLAKYRLLSSSEEHDNYILTAFLGVTAPTGPKRLSPGHTIITPTIAGGKGYGDFDVQSTVGVGFSNGGRARLGMPLGWNTAFQYRLCQYFWPEVETNYTWWPDGDRTGKSQLFLTPGLLVGRLPLWDRLGITIGAGYQVALTKHPQYFNGWILSIRTPF